MTRALGLMDVASATVMVFVVMTTIKQGAPSAGAFDPQAAQQGKAVFEGQARCATCHVLPAELHGLATREKGFYHDGRYRTLDAVVNHYDTDLKLQLTEDQKRQLIAYLKSR